MSNLFLTLLIAFVLIVCAIALLAIGWLFSGKNCLKKGCGSFSEKKDKNCTHCCEQCDRPPNDSHIEKNK